MKTGAKPDVIEADREAARILKLKFLKARHPAKVSVQEIAEAFAAHRVQQARPE
jgi:hypothetical protein